VEIGHTQVDPYGKRCYCGNHGCLETIASVESVLELAQVRLSQSMSSTLHGQPLTVDSLCAAARRAICWRRTSLPVWGITSAAFWPSW
jgi:transcriptional regulator of PTS gene